MQKYKKNFLTFSPDHGMKISFLEEKKIWIFFGDDGGGDGDDDGDDDAIKAQSSSVVPLVPGGARMYC